MNKTTGYGSVFPLIKSVRFPKGKIVLLLADCRVIILPLSRFPEIERLAPSQKRKHKLLAGSGLMFDDLDTVFHVSDFLGKVVSHGFSLVADQQNTYFRKLNYPVSKSLLNELMMVKKIVKE